MLSSREVYFLHVALPSTKHQPASSGLFHARTQAASSRGLFLFVQGEHRVSEQAPWASKHRRLERVQGYLVSCLAAQTPDLMAIVTGVCLPARRESRPPPSFRKAGAHTAPSTFSAGPWGLLPPSQFPRHAVRRRPFIPSPPCTRTVGFSFGEIQVSRYSASIAHHARQRGARTLPLNLTLEERQEQRRLDAQTDGHLFVPARSPEQVRADLASQAPFLHNSSDAI